MDACSLGVWLCGWLASELTELCGRGWLATGQVKWRVKWPACEAVVWVCGALSRQAASECRGPLSR